jgi:hypothetical protein
MRPRLFPSVTIHTIHNHSTLWRPRHSHWHRWMNYEIKYNNLQCLSEDFFLQMNIRRVTSGFHCTETHVGLHVKCPSLSGFRHNWDVWSCSVSNFSKIRSAVTTCGHMATHTRQIWLSKLAYLCNFSLRTLQRGGARGSVVVEALCYKPEGRGIASRWGGFFSNLPNPTGRTMALGSTQPLTEMSTRNLKKRSLGVKCGRRLGLTTLPSSVSRLSK